MTPDAERALREAADVCPGGGGWSPDRPRLCCRRIAAALLRAEARGYRAGNDAARPMEAERLEAAAEEVEFMIGHPPKPRTVRVRIAVAMDSEGRRWFAIGAHDSTGVDAASQTGGGGRSFAAFVEADVPLPEPVTVEGEVSRD